MHTNHSPSRRWICQALLALTPLGSIAAAVTTQDYAWDNVVIGGGGFVPSIVFHPTAAGVAYASTDMGGAYRLGPDRRWIPITDHFTSYEQTGIESIALDARDPERVFLMTGTTTGNSTGHLLRSSNRGVTWDTIAFPFACGGNDAGRQAGDRLVVDPCLGTVLFAGTRQKGLYVSRDRGDSWNQVGKFPVTDTTGGTWPNMGVTCVLIDKRSGKAGSTACSTIYAGVATTGTNFYRSTDGGTTWKALPNQPTMTTPRSGASASAMFPFHAVLATNGMLYVTYGNSTDLVGVSDGEVYRFDTAKDTWTRITPDKAGQGGFSGVATLPTDGKVVMVTTYDRWWPDDEVYRSTDSGTTWRAMKATSKFDASYSPFLRGDAKSDAEIDIGHWISCIAIDPTHPERVLYTTGGGIWGSDDIDHLDSGSATHWQPRTQGLEEVALHDLVCPPTGPLLLSAMGDQGGFVHSNLATSPNSLTPRFGSMTGVAVAWQKPSVMARVGEGPNIGTTGCWSGDSGATWASFTTVPVTGAKNGTVTITADGSAIIWAPEKTRPYRSTDHGKTWTACSGFNAYATPTADPADATKVYAITSDGTLYRSTNGGVSFTAGAKVPYPTETRVQAMPGRTGDLWIASWNGLFRSTDGGVTVNKVSSDITAAVCVGFGKAASGAKTPAIFMCGTIGGNERVFRSDDTGTNWEQITDATHHWGAFSHIIGDMRTYGRCYLTTNGRGIIVGVPAAGGSLSLKQNAITASESAGTVKVAVARTGSSAGSVSVQWQTVAGSAAVNSRYTSDFGKLTWADGDTKDKTISVSLVNDTVRGQKDQTFTIALSTPQGGAILGSTTSAVVTVTDDDTTTTSTPTPTSTSTVATSNLIAHIPFNEGRGSTAADASGNKNNATLVNGPTWTTRSSGSCSVFAKASSQYATLPNGIVKNLKECTIAAWVYPTTSNTWQRVFDFGTDTDTYMFLTTSDSNAVHFGIRTSSVAEQTIIGSKELPTGTWSHVAVVLSGSTGKLYVNGVLVGSNPKMTIKPSDLGNTTHNWLGRSQFASDPYLDGRIDDFRIYNRSLSQVAIEALASTTALSTLRVHIPFDEGKGNDARDCSGNGWTATLYNKPAWADGKLNHAIDLVPTSSQYAALPDGVVNDMKTCTISTWVCLDGISKWQRVFDFGTGTNNYMFLTTTNGNAVRFGIRTPSVAEQQITGKAALPTGAWTHVAVVLNGATGTLYVNGVAVGTNTKMTLNPASLGKTTKNWIGRSQFGSDPYFNGLIDDFRIYGGVLAETQIAAIAKKTGTVAANDRTADEYQGIAMLYRWPLR